MGGVPTVLDAAEAVCAPAEEAEVAYTARDACTYALGVGCRASVAAERPYVWPYAAGGRAGPPTLPTFALALAFRGDEDEGLANEFPPRGLLPGFPRGQIRVPLVHAEQRLEVLRPLAAAGRVRLSARTVAVRAMRRGGGALWETETLVRDAADGVACARMVSTTLVRGVSVRDAQGDAPASGSASGPKRPESRGEPDAVMDLTSSEEQAALYALSGDGNPMHVDPGVARAAGFDRPILHGLCTLGFAVRAVLAAFRVLEDPGALRSVQVRFASPVFPGETLRTRMWKVQGGEKTSPETTVEFETVAPDRGDVVVLSRGLCCLARSGPASTSRL